MSSESPSQKVTESLQDSKPQNSQSPHQVALNVDGKDVEVIHRATVSTPKILKSPSDSVFLASITKDHIDTTSAPSEDVNDPNFVLTGKIQLFNQQDLTLDFFSYHGPLPQTCKEILPEGEVPVYQMAVLNKGQLIKVSALIPQFKDTKFDSFAIENIRVLYQVRTTFLSLPRF